MPVEKSGIDSVYELGVSPWLLLLIALVPLVLLMWGWKIFPTGRLAVAAVVPFAMSLAIPWLPPAWWVRSPRP